MELNEREAHCVARLLQGAFLGESVLNCCEYCKYPCYDDSNRCLWFANVIRDKFTDETGVSLGATPHKTDLNGFARPFNKFLVNANPKARGLVERYLKDVAEGKRANIGEFERSDMMKGYALKLTFTMTEAAEPEKLNALVKHVKEEFGEAFVTAIFTEMPLRDDE